MEKGDYPCLHCGKRYLGIYSLRRHLRESHPIELDSAPLPNRKYKCDKCYNQYNTKRFLNHHIRKVHLVAPTQPKTSQYRCSICSYSGSKFYLLKHFRKSHNISIEVEELVFTKNAGFMAWKEAVEKATNSKFICSSGLQCNRRTQFMYYGCSRSGNCKPKIAIVRHFKRQRSKKINGFCPASMNVTFTCGLIKVHHTKTHIGHEHERNEVICVDLNLLVDDHKTMKDYTPCDLTGTYSHSTKNLNKWISDMHNHDKSVLLYKPTGVIIEELSDLKIEDFILLIMNDAQKDLLQLYGSNIICIDRILGINQLELITLSVLDDVKEAVTCAILLTSRCDEKILTIFFKTVCEKVGNLSPKIIMSDTPEFIYKAFIAVTNSFPTKLCCPWHVDDCWKKNLIKIPSIVKRDELYRSLHFLLVEKDAKIFDAKFNDLVNNMLLDPDMLDFGTYFMQTYSKNVESWAISHAVECGLHTHDRLEQLNFTLKYIYFYSEVAGRFDKMLEMLWRFVNNRLQETKNEVKDKIANKLLALRNRHKLSLKLNDGAITKHEDKGWTVHFQGSADLHIIPRNIRCNCGIWCSMCESCPHEFICSCFDSSIKWNMCKHIHYLRRTLHTKEHTTREKDLDVKNLFVLHSAEQNIADTINQQTSKFLLDIPQNAPSIKQDCEVYISSDVCNPPNIHSEIVIKDDLANDLDTDLKILIGDFSNVFNKITTIDGYLSAKNHLDALEYSLSVLNKNSEH